MLVGQQVARNGFRPQEMQSWKNIRESWRQAAAAFSVDEAMRYFASPARAGKAGALA